MSDPITFPQASALPQATAQARATHVRWWILVIIMLIMAVTALCRLNLSIAGKYIQDEFKLDTLTMGHVFAAFLWGYAVFQIPWGYAGDRYGPRRVLTVSILLWSFGAAAMGIAPWIAGAAGVSVLWAFVVVRFVTGIGEAAVTPNVMRLIAYWTAVRERGLASGLQITGLGLGGTLTPIFISWTMVHWGWRVSFYLCGALGFLVLLTMRFYATDRPEEHSSVSRAELDQIHFRRDTAPGPRGARTPATCVPWGRMLTSVSVWGLILGYACQGYAFYVYYNWFYLYAVKVRNLPLMQAAVWTSIPFVSIAVLSAIGGLLSDRISKKLGRRRGRQCAVWLGMGLSATLLYLGSHISDSAIALPLIGFAAGFNMFGAASFWAACIDLAPDYSASLSGLMNTLGNIGGAISSIITASIATRFNWSMALDLAALITVFSGLCWFLVDVSASLDERAAG